MKNYELIVDGTRYVLSASKLHTALYRVGYKLDAASSGTIQFRVLGTAHKVVCPLCGAKYYNGEQAQHEEGMYHKHEIERKQRLAEQQAKPEAAPAPAPGPDAIRAKELERQAGVKIEERVDETRCRKCGKPRWNVDNALMCPACDVEFFKALGRGD